LKISVSQGSVATQLGCGGMFTNFVIADCPQKVLVKKKIKNRSKFGEDMDKSWRCAFLATLQCRLQL